MTKLSRGSDKQKQEPIKNSKELKKVLDKLKAMR